jgi:hypothetical protein
MEKICKNCDMWGSYIQDVCNFTTHIGSDKGLKRFEVVAYADDDQGLEGFLKTGPEFGCVHFTPKTKVNHGR